MHNEKYISWKLVICDLDSWFRGKNQSYGNFFATIYVNQLISIPIKAKLKAKREKASKLCQNNYNPGNQ